MDEWSVRRGREKTRGTGFCILPQRQRKGLFFPPLVRDAGVAWKILLCGSVFKVGAKLNEIIIVCLCACVLGGWGAGIK